MKTTTAHNEKIAKITFGSVYPHYIKKAESKGRTINELHEVITWLTGFNDNQIKELIKDNVTFEMFFNHAKLNPNAVSYTI